MLRQIDEFFAQRKKSEKYLIYATIFLAIFLASYQYLLPYTEKLLKKAKNEKRAIQAKIDVDKAYLRGITVNGDELYYIKKYTQQIEDLKKSFLAINDKKEYLDNKIKELSYLLYNKKKWAQFLNSLTQLANKHNIEINYILNNFLDVTKTFGHVLEVEISCLGDFKNTIAYVNDIEQSDLVVDVYEMKMSSNMPIETLIKVSVWGINY